MVRKANVECQNNGKRSMAHLISKLIFWIIAAFYAYGALVHTVNMLGLSGFDWQNAPSKCQMFDVVYLVLDVIVAIGFVLAWRLGLVAFLLRR